jgi:hypothetical protein
MCGTTNNPRNLSLYIRPEQGCWRVDTRPDWHPGRPAAKSNHVILPKCPEFQLSHGAKPSGEQETAIVVGTISHSRVVVGMDQSHCLAYKIEEFIHDIFVFCWVL